MGTLLLYCVPRAYSFMVCICQEGMQINRFILIAGSLVIVYRLTFQLGPTHIMGPPLVVTYAQVDAIQCLSLIQVLDFQPEVLQP